MTEPTFTARATLMGDKADRASIHWQDATHRFHVWVHPDGAGRWTMSSQDQTIYKNGLIPQKYAKAQKLSTLAKAHQTTLAAAIAFANSGAIEADAAARVQAEADKDADALTKRAVATRAALQTSLNASDARTRNPTRQQALREALWFIDGMSDQELDDLRRAVMQAGN